MYIRVKNVYSALQAYAHFYYRWSMSAAMDRKKHQWASLCTRFGRLADHSTTSAA